MAQEKRETNGFYRETAPRIPGRTLSIPAVRQETLYAKLFKRAIDVIVSFALLCILLPLFVILSMLVFLDDPHGSPFYVQRRIGKNGKSFRFYKFRTMVVGADTKLEALLPANEMDGPVFKIKQDPRITRVGTFLRKHSLDELPQLLNVFKGDMSLVGPRPPLPREYIHYDEYCQRRMDVLPGLTCYWQVTPKRNDLPFDEWMDLDMKYIREQSAWVDLKILFLTVVTVLRGEGC